MPVCNSTGEKCPKVVRKFQTIFSITVNKNCPKVADNFSNINENNSYFHECKQKLSARQFLCLRLCRRVEVFLPWGISLIKCTCERNQNLYYCFPKYFREIIMCKFLILEEFPLFYVEKQKIHVSIFSSKYRVNQKSCPRYYYLLCLNYYNQKCVCLDIL